MKVGKKNTASIQYIVKCSKTQVKKRQNEKKKQKKQIAKSVTINDILDEMQLRIKVLFCI